MDSLRIDFAPRPRLSISTAGALVLVAALFMVVLVLHLAANEDSRNRQAMEVNAQATKHAKVNAPIGVQDQANQAAIKEASTVLDTLSVPWDELFLSIEATNVEGLGLLTLAPDPRSGNLHISGEGASLDDVLAYVTRLTIQHGFRDVNLVSYDSVQRDGQDVVQFSLVAKWK